MVGGVNGALDPSLRSVVAPQLQRGETLLWVGKPAPFRILLRDRRVVTTGIAMLVALLALGAILLVFPNSHLLAFHFAGMGVSFGLIVLAFLLLGLSYFARPIYEYFMARRTIYALTDRRALILKGTLRGRKAQSLHQFEQIKRRALLKGKSDLIFASETYRVRRNSRVSTRTRSVGFFGIDNAREVEQIMIATFKAQPTSEPS